MKNKRKKKRRQTETEMKMEMEMEMEGHWRNGKLGSVKSVDGTKRESSSVYIAKWGTRRIWRSASQLSVVGYLMISRPEMPRTRRRLTFHVLPLQSLLCFIPFSTDYCCYHWDFHQRYYTCFYFYFYFIIFYFCFCSYYARNTCPGMQKKRMRQEKYIRNTTTSFSSLFSSAFVPNLILILFVISRLNQ